MKPPDDEIKDSFKAVKMTLNTICSNGESRYYKRIECLVTLKVK